MKKPLIVLVRGINNPERCDRVGVKVPKEPLGRTCLNPKFYSPMLKSRFALELFRAPAQASRNADWKITRRDDRLWSLELSRYRAGRAELS